MNIRRTGTVHHIVDARTAAVRVDRQVRHPKYGKSYRRTTKLLVDVEPKTALTPGTVVSIEAVRPISQRKSWRVGGVQKSDVRNQHSDFGEELVEADMAVVNPTSDIRLPISETPEESQ